MEERAEVIFAAIERMGEGSMLRGVVRGVETAWFTTEIAEAAFEEQQRVEAGELLQVGVNAFVEDEGALPEILAIGHETEHFQRRAVADTRSSRDPGAADAALAGLADAAREDGVDLMRPLIACARARCTGGEVTRALQDVFGTWRETPAL
jgi:methylmalonyl-CoA mutase N-terminal domain/subunit